MNTKLNLRSASRLFFGALLFAGTAIPILADDPFADIVRKTEPLAPWQEQKKFHLPAGFEIQLVACEPDISKPMNMAFDTKGRLWISQSTEYPHPVLPVEKPGRDKIMVIENFDDKGRAQKISAFVDGLNIPIGLYPYKNGVIAFTIPKIHYFQDTDGDGRSDKDDLVLTGFGYQKDTHGLTSAFRRGYDGWIYADHGFNNDSEITAKDGSVIKINSGNCYRFRPDGSHVESYSYGQVNPFGLMFDHLGDLWSADCHSSPVYQLLRGAYYPSFGKPHDGLGFAPNICGHSHGSTAIAGIVFYAATNFPTEFQNNTYVGNVMTCRINRDSYIEHGSTRVAKEEPDFLTCDDPWFRPVDVQLGPDGAIYVADFYNRIIGHYEVPLDHPGRDRERGRIWRIVYKGVAQASSLQVSKLPASKSRQDASEPAARMAALQFPDLSKASVSQLITELGNSNITRRMLAMNELTDRVGKDAIKPLEKLLKDKKANSFQKIHGLWALQRLGALEGKSLQSLAADANRDVRVHVMRVLGDVEKWDSGLARLAMTGTGDADLYVRRAAAEALGRHPSAEFVQPLLTTMRSTAKDDAQLLHVIRMALRNQLQAPGSLSKLLGSDLSEVESRTIAEVAVGVKGADAGEFLLRHIQKVSEDRDKMSNYLRHAARYAPESRMDDLAKFTREKFADDIDFQLALFKSVQEGTQQRGAKLAPAVSEWGAQLAEALLASVDPNSLDWRNSPIKESVTVNPWFMEERPCADGKTTRVISSFSPGGESYTGILRSKPFTIPAKFSFYLCGHDGSPDKPARKKNLIRLRDADTKKVLADEFPPRNDTAQLITWDLSKHAGKKGYLEIVDGNNGHSYAWIGVGRFDPAVLPMPKVIPNQVDKRQLSAAEIAESLKLAKLEPKLLGLLQNDDADVDARAAAAKALVAMNPTAQIPTLSRIVSRAEAPAKLREKCAQGLAQINSAESKAALIEAMQNAPHQLQTQIALALASNPDGAETLLQAVEQGKTSAHVLQENPVKDRLAATKPQNLTARLEKLTKGLAPISEEKQKLIDQRRAAFVSAEPSPEKGQKIFEQNCMVCHQLDGKGAVVGPQLDGVGNRGADRLMEDILDPNRAVDPAFRYSNVTLKNDEVISGLFRREEGEVLVLVDGAGKEVSVPKKEIAERKQSENSLMPDNFSDLIPEQDFYDLISFLTTKSSKAEAKK